MSKTNALENSLLGLIFNAATIANLADNAVSSPATVLWAALHTADPGEAGAQNTSEASFAGYARTSVARTTAGFVVSSGTVSPVSPITYPTATSTSTGTITHASFGLSSAGAGTLLYKGAVTPNIDFGQNTIARLTTASQISED